MDRSFFEKAIKTKYENFQLGKFQRKNHEITLKFTISVDGYEPKLFSDNTIKIQNQLNSNQYLYDGDYLDNFESLLTEIQKFINAKYTKIAMGNYWEKPIEVPLYDGITMNIAVEVAQEYARQNSVHVDDDSFKWEIKEV